MIHDYILNEVFTCGTFLYKGLHQTYNITISIQLYMSGARIQQDHEMPKCQHSQYQDEHMIHNYMWIFILLVPWLFGGQSGTDD